MKFKVTYDMGYCGTDETVIVEASNESEAYDIILQEACEKISITVEDATDEDIEDFE